MTQTVRTYRRVDALINLSDRVYDAIDTEVGGVPRSERIVLLGVSSIAQVLRTSYSHRLPGDQFQALLAHEMSYGGLDIEDKAYDFWSNYRAVVDDLPPHASVVHAQQDVTELARRYSGVQRATLSRDGTFETDARHAVHLSALALPYAAEVYPDLDMAKIALYSLLHDIVEAYAGDVPSLNISDSVMRAKQAAEAAAIRQLTHDFGVAYPQFVQLIHDYENLVDDEARFVKTFDKLDPAFTQSANRGISLTRDFGIQSASELLRGIEATTERMRAYAIDFPEVMADHEELNLRVADMVDWPQ